MSVTLIQAGGIAARTPSYGQPLLDRAIANRVLASQADRFFTERTGGVIGLYEEADKPLARLLRTTAFEYLLGFYPTDPPTEGEYRDLRVAVARRGVTLSYRHGYQTETHLATPELLDFRRLFAESAILRAAAAASQRLANIPMKLSAVATRRGAAQEEVAVTVGIDPTYVTTARKEGRYVVSLDVAVFVRDAQEKLLAEKWDRIDLDLDEGGYRQLRRERIQQRATVTVAGRAAQVKVVVYEFDSGRTAHSTVRVTGRK